MSLSCGLPSPLPLISCRDCDNMIRTALKYGIHISPKCKIHRKKNGLYLFIKAYTTKFNKKIHLLDRIVTLKSEIKKIDKKLKFNDYFEWIFSNLLIPEIRLILNIFLLNSKGTKEEISKRLAKYLTLDVQIELLQKYILEVEPNWLDN